MTFKMSNYFTNPFLGYADIKGSIGVVLHYKSLVKPYSHYTYTHYGYCNSRHVLISLVKTDSK